MLVDAAAVPAEADAAANPVMGLAVSSAAHLAVMFFPQAPGDLPSAEMNTPCCHFQAALFFCLPGLPALR